MPEGSGMLIHLNAHKILRQGEFNNTVCFYFQDFVIGLSILVRGTIEEKMRWMFSLYDQDRDGFISR